MKIFIGIVGEIGAGKGSVVKILHDEFDGRMMGVKILRFSDILKETLALWGLEPSRENFQKMAQAMEEKFGSGTLARAVERRILKEAADVVIADGVRWPADYELVRRIPGNTLVYVTSPAVLRYERMKDRGEKTSEHELLWEKFIADEAAPNEVNIPIIGASADYRIDNAGSYDDLASCVETIARAILSKIN